ncbi:MAG: competence/damage-inducible protein A [Alphaproteobacteria bacterium]|nr:competence/damage-inducible protein A [Alphaproteobacteria bacterium]
MSPAAPTACIIIIGNEILSGRTEDVNLHWLAQALGEMGIRLRESRVILDDEAAIVETVNACRKRFDYIFTTGGIGPTHDDITSASIAKAFGVELARHPDAEAALRAHYGTERLNAPRLKMADIPRGAELIANPVSAAPGYYLENVFVMAGVPVIMRAMFNDIRHLLKGGPPLLSRTLSAHVTEGMIAEALAQIQHSHREVEIGSYPFIKDGRLGVSLVVRGTDGAALEKAAEEIEGLLHRHTQAVAIS